MIKTRQMARALFCTALLASCTLVSAEKAPVVSKSMVDGWRQTLSNAGRWGKNDQLGALNLITPEKRRQAAALVKEGISVSMQHPMLTEKASDNPSPLEHSMIATGAKDNTGAYSFDKLSIDYHGIGHTHLDALCHAWHNGKLYNNIDRSVVSKDGCQQLDISKVGQGIVTRGILIDMPLLRGVEYLAPGTPIYPTDLEAFEKYAGLKISSGDALFIRTGRWAMRDKNGPADLFQGSAGLHASVLPWLHKRGIALLASDAAADVFPSGVTGMPKVTGPENISLPIHEVVLVTMGVSIIDNADLRAVAAQAAEIGRYEFMLNVAPLRVSGGTGSPVNPLAVF